jgi:hypothetical protein
MRPVVHGASGRYFQIRIQKILQWDSHEPKAGNKFVNEFARIYSVGMFIDMLISSAYNVIAY